MEKECEAPRLAPIEKMMAQTFVLPNSPTRLADGLELEVFFVNLLKHKRHDAPQVSTIARLLVPPRYPAALAGGISNFGRQLLMERMLQPTYG